MCRNIKTLFNFDPPATELEIRDASLQFVRKLSGFNVPSKANEEAFERAVEEVAAAARSLIKSLVTSAEPRNREVEAEKAKAGRRCASVATSEPGTPACASKDLDDAPPWAPAAACLGARPAGLRLRPPHHRGL
jgi:hypothetical protein